MRPVTVLATGGTIAMRGEHAEPALDGWAVVASALDEDDAAGLEVRDLMNRPGAHVTPEDALAVAREAGRVAEGGRGVVVTCGTDTMEELAMLADLHLGADAPVVFTGANRPASQPGADGPANLADAVTVAAHPSAAGLGCVLVFAGEIHAARLVTKVDATGPRAFGSPQGGPVGRVIGGVPWLWARPERQPQVHPERMDARVEIVTTHLGDDGRLLDGAAAVSDGVVAVVMGAGHCPPDFLDALERASGVVPVVVTTRVARGGMLADTYGFRGAERDVRQAGAVPAGLLTPAAARVKLAACLGAGLSRAQVAVAFAADDAHPG